MKFTVEMSPNPRKFTLAFDEWAKEVQDWRRAWTDIRKLFYNHERQHFDSEGATTGAKFAPLTGRAAWWYENLPYKEWKGKHYPGLPILQRSRVLYNALTSGGRGSLFKRSRKSMESGIKKPSGQPGQVETYARAHQGKDGQGLGPAYQPSNYPRFRTTPINRTARPPVRANLNVKDKSTFGYAASQIMQAHIVLARRRAFSKEVEDAVQKARLESSTAAKSTIKKMIKGTWR